MCYIYFSSRMALVIYACEQTLADFLNSACRLFCTFDFTIIKLCLNRQEPGSPIIYICILASIYELAHIYIH
jgi:hypothetical protein